jgi:hypothetical protein
MTFADLLTLGLSLVLAGYAFLSVLAVRRTRDPAALAVFGLTAYWTVIGAFSILQAKREAGGTVYTYMEDRLFLVLVDGDYATTLLAYSAFMLVLVLGYLMWSKPARPGRDLSAQWQAVAERFSHPVLISIVGVAAAARLALVVFLVRANAGETSLYAATRTVKGGESGLLRAYQYLNVLGSYSVVCGLGLWLGFATARARYRPTTRLALWLGYAVLTAEALGENALLGNRAVPLLMMGAIAAGWLRWLYVPAPPHRRRRLALQFVMAAVLGVFALGMIGASRGGGLTTPGAVLARLASSVTLVTEVIDQVAGSSERLASHMSLYGLIHQEELPLSPWASNSYAAYATQVNAPDDQVFTIHYVAAWWIRLGPLAPLVAGVTFAVVMVALQLLSRGPIGMIRAGLALPAAVLPAAGLPITLVRSGPESIRAVVIELVLIPGAAAMLCLWVGARSAARLADPRPDELPWGAEPDATDPDPRPLIASRPGAPVGAIRTGPPQ